MADTKYESYATGEDGQVFIHTGDRKICQTFKPSVTHILTKVVLKVFREGSPGDVVVAIKGTTDGKPSGIDLDSATLSANGWNTAPPTWKTFTMSGGITLTAGVTYAIVMSCAAADASNQPNWRGDMTSGGYLDGSVGAANDGTTWTMFTDDDTYFEEWGSLGGWGGTFLGVATPSHIIGVAKADIANVIGVE